MNDEARQLTGEKTVYIYCLDSLRHEKPSYRHFRRAGICITQRDEAPMNSA